MNEENKTNQEEISSDIANILDEIQGDSKTNIEDAKSEQKEKTKDQVAIEDAFKEVNQNKKHNKKSDKQKKQQSEFQKELGKKENPEEVKKEIKRINADPNVGLSVEQVIERINKGYVNKTINNNVKTYASIFISNICTFFNILCFAVAISLVIAGSFKNLVFMLVAFCNTAIGILQEIRAKRTIEKLSLLTAPTAKVIRGGSEYEITTAEVVIDDIVVLKNGKQIVADAIVVEGSVEVNESLLTGESVNIKKSVGDILYSGSFISSGNCKARVDKVGEDCYVEQLSQKAKQYKKPKSELFNSLNLTIKVIGFIIIPLAIGMYINNYMNTGGNFSDTVAKSAGAVIGMIPSGMFLLCSIALTVSVIRLAQRKALVQDLYCVEMLARVNVLCLDKTGTITDGSMKVYNFIEVQNKSGMTLKRIMGSFLSAQNDNNQTSQCLVNYFGYNKELKPQAVLPFSSTRKLSAVTFDGLGTYILGAPEFVLPNMKEGKVKDMIEQYAKDGYRVLVLANCSGQISHDNLPNTNRNPVAVIVLEDRIREDAIETIKWFKENDVKIKIISGDNPLTVAEIAKRVGVTDTESFINLEGLSNNQVIQAANKYTVFGRVTPEQKAILVKAMKA
ncbi:MAG: HAD-IC family P-type ATPase, partial [Clostridia bacterium]|nr:HAD-IC family P-type ATPase [Clostridia bacterium]